MGSVANLLNQTENGAGSRSNIPENIFEEWKEFFASGIFSVVLNSFVKLSSKGFHNRETHSQQANLERALLNSLGTAVINIPDDQLFEHSLVSNPGSGQK